MRFYITRYYEKLYYKVPNTMRSNCSNDFYETFSLTLSHICSCSEGSDPMDEKSPWVETVRTFEWHFSVANKITLSISNTSVLVRDKFITNQIKSNTN